MWLSIDLAGMIRLCIDFIHRVINKFVCIKDQNQKQFMYYYNANKQLFALEHFERKKNQGKDQEQQTTTKIHWVTNVYRAGKSSE